MKTDWKVGDTCYIRTDKSYVGTITKVGRKWVTAKSQGVTYEFDSTNGYCPKGPCYGYAPELTTLEEVDLEDRRAGARIAAMHLEDFIRRCDDKALLITIKQHIDTWMGVKRTGDGA